METVLYFLFYLLFQKGESADHLHIWTYTKWNYGRFVLQRSLRYVVYLPYNSPHGREHLLIIFIKVLPIRSYKDGVDS